MGRKGSTLIPFLVKGLKSNKYGSFLSFTDQNKDIFHMILPRLTRDLRPEAMLMLKDWCKEKQREEFDYTKAKQAMLAALRKSVFLENVRGLRHPLTFRILKPEEVKEKRLQQRDEMKSKLRKCSIYDSPSSVESGYSSYTDYENEVLPSNSEENYQNGISIPVVVSENNNLDDLLLSIQHDHDFGLSLEQDGTIQENPRSSDFANYDNLGNLRNRDDMLMDFEVSESEWKQYMDDLLNGIPSLDDFPCEIKEKEESNIVYKYKDEILVTENIIMMTLESEEKGLHSRANSGGQSGVSLALDINILKNIQACKIIKYVFVGDYLQLFLKPAAIGVE